MEEVIQTHRYLTEAQVSKVTGRSRSALQKDRCRRKGIPYIKIGHQIRYMYGDVTGWMESNRVDTD